MKKIIQILLITVFLYSCSDSVTTFNYAGFENTTLELGVPIAGEKMHEVKVYTSVMTSSDRTFNISVVEDGTTIDAGSYTMSQSVTIPANKNVGTFNIDLKDLNIGEDGKKLVLSLASASNEFTGENVVIDIVQICELNQVVLKLTFDQYPEEVYWRLRDSSGNTISESKTPAGFGAYDGMANGSELIKKFCLPNGDYTFSIFDGYSDGAGAYSLTNGDTTIHSSTGAYGAGENVNFTVTK